ncbi:MAG TPA: hypothetical protein VK817_24335 [Trebonia sp.]|nr:hypothetical protein [Trebonia sp.]
MALTVAVAGLCAASGSAVTAEGAVSLPVSGIPAAVTDTQATAEPPINVGLYDDCIDPSKWLGPPIVHALHPASAYLAGWADTKKLNGSLPAGYPEPALAESAGSGEGKQAGALLAGTDTYLCARAILQLDDHGLRELPPVRATFLAYGFMPVTATVQLVQPGPRDFSACIEANGTTSPACPPLTATVIDDTTPGAENNTYQVVSTAELSLRISDVSVNGTPLDVGASCQAGPVTTPGNPIHYDGVVLTGGNVAGDPEPQYSAVIYGGALDGSVYIPPVSGCGANGDLDPLLTSAISGPGNYARFVQSLLCTSSGIEGSCAADGITPTVSPLWTVAHGGAYSSSAPAEFTISGSDTVECAASAISGGIPSSAGPPRGGLGTLHWTFSDCAGYNPDGTPDGSTWTVTQQGVGYVDGVEPGAMQAEPGAVFLKLTGLSLTFRGWGDGTGGTKGSPCQVVETGGAPITYTDPAGSSSAVLAVESFGAGSTQLDMPSDTCADIGDGALVSAVATYPLRTGRGITITNLPPPSS